MALEGLKALTRLTLKRAKQSLVLKRDVLPQGFHYKGHYAVRAELLLLRPKITILARNNSTRAWEGFVTGPNGHPESGFSSCVLAGDGLWQDGRQTFDART